MTKEDIIGGLKNALERGETLERAKSTFINAGYKEEEVEEAAKLVGEKKLKEKETPVPRSIKPSVKTSVPSPVSAPAPSAQPAQAIGKPLPSLQVKPKKKSPITAVLIIVAVILFLLILNLVRVMLGIKIV